MSKPFIHPDILLKIRENSNTNKTESLDMQSYSNAKVLGEKAANDLLKNLFSRRQEYGSIESHFNTEKLSSSQYLDFREQIVTLHYQKKTLHKEIRKLISEESLLLKKLNSLERSIFKMFYKKKILLLKIELNDVSNKKTTIQSSESESYINLDYLFEDINIKEGYSNLYSSFITLKSAKKIWDVTTTKANLDTKAAASTTIFRNEVRFDPSGINIIRTKEKVFHFENHNGGDFYFYPNFIIYYKNQDDIAIIDYSDLYLEYEEVRFLEQTKDIVDDVTKLGETWYRVNKDGSPDRRFVGNYKIPIVKYGSLHFKTTTGVNELYYTSDYKLAKHFSEQFHNYRSLIKYSSCEV